MLVSGALLQSKTGRHTYRLQMFHLNNLCQTRHHVQCRRESEGIQRYSDPLIDQVVHNQERGDTLHTDENSCVQTTGPFELLKGEEEEWIESQQQPAEVSPDSR